MVNDIARLVQGEYIRTYKDKENSEDRFVFSIGENLAANLDRLYTDYFTDNDRAAFNKMLQQKSIAIHPFCDTHARTKSVVLSGSILQLPDYDSLENSQCSSSTVHAPEVKTPLRALSDGIE